MRIWMAALVWIGCDGGSVSLRPPAADTDTVDDTDIDTDPAVDRFECEPFGVSIGTAAVIDHNSNIRALSGPEPVILPTTISVNSTTACAFNVRSGYVAADIDVGPRGYPDVVICEDRSGEAAGEQGILASDIELLVPPIPTDLPDSGGDKLMEWNESARFTVDRRFDSLIVRTNAELVIDGDIDIHVTGDVELNRGVLVLTEGSELDLWVDGNMRALWQSRVNVDGDPSALRIHLTERASFGLDQGAVVAGRVRAPSGEVSIRGRQSAFIGTVQADELSVVWGGSLLVPDELICPR